MAKACAHRWQPYTKWKARCAKCGKRTPWLSLLKAADDRFDLFLAAYRTTLTGTAMKLRDIAAHLTKHERPRKR